MQGIVGKWLIALLLIASLTGANVGTVPVGAADYPDGPSQSVAVTGAVQTEMTFAVPDLQALPTHTTMAETRTRMGTQGTVMYRGVLLKDVLDAAKLQLDPNIKNDVLSRAITAYGSDGYHVTFSYGEIDPDFGGQPILVAFEKNGQPLTESDGTMELIVPGGNLAGRWVKNLVNLTVTAPAAPTT